MDMHVRDSLSGGWSIVDANVEGLGRELHVENTFLFPDEFEKRVLLLGK